MIRAPACDAVVIPLCNLTKEVTPELGSGPDRGRRSGYRERGESYNGKPDLDSSGAASFRDCGNWGRRTYRQWQHQFTSVHINISGHVASIISQTGARTCADDDVPESPAAKDS